MRVKFPYPARSTKLSFFLANSGLEKKIASHKSACLVQDTGMPALHGVNHFSIKLPAGEPCKKWQQLEFILSQLAEKNVERTTSMIVIGGGAALDTGAFAASIYRRGMPLILVPTTLLAMVDATIGGKTAIDHGAGADLKKNFAGTFYPANEVWICLDFLKSLPKKERISGAGEVWKTLWIAGKKSSKQSLQDYVENAEISKGLLQTVKACLEIKKKIVQRDPLDQKRIREVLNFGHTVGHALESLADGALSHGEAVLWGMAVETSLLGKKGAAMQKEIFTVLHEMNLSIPQVFAKNNFLPALLADKKKKAGVWELSLLEKPGKIIRVKKNAEDLEVAIKAFPEFFRRVSSHPQL